MRNLIVCVAMLACACAGEDGAIGPTGPQGNTANINQLQARVDSLEALITYALGGSPETEDPLNISEQTTLLLASNLGSDYTNFATDTKIFGELNNTGNFDALDVQIFFRLRGDGGVAISDKTVRLGTVRSGASILFNFTLDGPPSDYETASYTITYTNGSDRSGDIKITRL